MNRTRVRRNIHACVKQERESMGGSGENVLRQRLIQKGRLCVTHSGNVYDVTEFADRHPGGREWLRKYAGQDVTRIMQESNPHRHSKAAYSILQKYRVSLQENDEQEGEAVGDGKMSFYSIQEDPLIDWSKPILGQIPGLGEKYYQWVHEPVDTSIRLFRSDLLEFFTRCSWYVVPIFWIPIALLLVLKSWASLMSGDPGSVTWNVLFVYEAKVTPEYLLPMVLMGILMWTFCEYTLHRWLFHMNPPSSVPFLLILHFALHGQHHKSPMDRSRLVFPPLPASILAMVIFSLYSMFAPWAVSQALFAGTIIGYIFYDLTHYYIHHGSPSSSYFSSLKRYHVKHHFEQQNLGFGISSKLWDYPFGTVIPDTV